MDLRRHLANFFRIGRPVGWTPATVLGALSLVLLWAWQVYTTWGAWGNLTVDSGHEMYVPALLSEGKTLYQDVWFAYSPAAAYFNSYLFRLFGVHLNVLYWAGSLSALIGGIFLYLIGMRLSAALVGWAAGAAQIAEAFQGSLFCFPLPYSFAAVYGSVLAAIFLWVVIAAIRSPGWLWMLLAASLAAIALLLKPEFGVAAYATLGLLIAIRWHRSVGSTGRDLLALIPGLLFCAYVVNWMISLRGVEFITRENIMSFPNWYFMQHFGKSWLEGNGFILTLPAFGAAAIRALFLAGVLLEVHLLCKLRRDRPVGWLLAFLVVPAALAAYVWKIRIDPPDLALAVTWPSDMVLYIAIAAAFSWLNYWWQAAEDREPALPILLSFSSLLAFRILMGMGPHGYAIYYNGPVVLGYLLLARTLFPASTLVSRRLHVRKLFVLSVPALALAYAVGHYQSPASLAWLTTPRGSIRVAKNMAENYRLAIDFINEKKAAGEIVLSMPEDTSLYFLSETYAPSRLYLFTPGIVAPGKMTDDTIREIEQKRVRYLLWSNREFPEYGAPVFGRDFSPELGEFFTSHYVRVGPVTKAPGWQADVWERRPEMRFQ